MDYFIIGVASALASAMTLFSGFGLGTVLMPVFALFFPVSIAIAATAVVHLANNLFKLGLLGRQADWRVLLRFSVPAAIAAMVGAGLLSWFAGMPALIHYSVGGHHGEVTPEKALIGPLVVGFALLELSPRVNSLVIPSRYLPLGGILSGFFGGLSGNQGALRSAFLIRAGLSKEGFIATGIVSTVIVDVVRLAVYGVAFFAGSLAQSKTVVGYVAVGTGCAFLGAYVGVLLLPKVTLRGVQLSVAAMMLAVGIGLTAGFI